MEVYAVVSRPSTSHPYDAETEQEAFVAKLSITGMVLDTSHYYRVATRAGFRQGVLSIPGNQVPRGTLIFARTYGQRHATHNEYFASCVIHLEYSLLVYTEWSSS